MYSYLFKNDRVPFSIFPRLHVIVSSPGISFARVMLIFRYFFLYNLTALRSLLYYPSLVFVEVHYAVDSNFMIVYQEKRKNVST